MLWIMVKGGSRNAAVTSDPRVGESFFKAQQLLALPFLFIYLLATPDQVQHESAFADFYAITFLRRFLRTEQIVSKRNDVSGAD